MHAIVFVGAGLCSGILIGWFQQPGSLGDKAIASLIAGAVLAAFGAFVGVFVSKSIRLFGEHCRPPSRLQV